MTFIVTNQAVTPYFQNFSLFYYSDDHGKLMFLNKKQSAFCYKSVIK